MGLYNGVIFSMELSGGGVLVRNCVIFLENSDESFC